MLVFLTEEQGAKAFITLENSLLKPIKTEVYKSPPQAWGLAQRILQPFIDVHIGVINWQQ